MTRPVIRPRVVPAAPWPLVVREPWRPAFLGYRGDGKPGHLAWALYVECSAPYNLRLGALTVVAWTTLIGALILLPIALIFDSLGEFARLDDRLLGYWLYTAIFPVGVAFLGLTAGLDRLGVSRVMVYMYLIPVAGVGLSAAFFGDPLTAARVLGGLIVLAGVILTRVALDHAARLPV